MLVQAILCVLCFASEVGDHWGSCLGGYGWVERAFLSQEVVNASLSSVVSPDHLIFDLQKSHYSVALGHHTEL